jgi:hypothetical protein
LAIADVADFVLAADLGGKRTQAIFAPGDENAVAATRRECAHDRGADPARRAGDDGDVRYRQTRTRRAAATRFPAASVATASSTCRPCFAFAACHVAVKTKDYIFHPYQKR